MQKVPHTLTFNFIRKLKNVSGFLGATPRLAHFDVRRLHLHQRRALSSGAHRRGGRLDAANQIRAKTRQWHLRMPGKNKFSAQRNDEQKLVWRQSFALQLFNIFGVLLLPHFMTKTSKRKSSCAK